MRARRIGAALLSVVASLALSVTSSNAAPSLLSFLASDRYASIVLDGDSGRVLAATNADHTLHPASLTKIMTLYMTFEALKRGEPHQLAVDNRMVVPAGVPLRIQTTADSVIHAFAVPSLWFKMDAVPGRLNEKLLTIKEPGVYYGQCSELCGARHGYMPSAIEALPRDEFNRWVLEQGGKIDGMPDAPAAAAAPAPAAKPAA